MMAIFSPIGDFFAPQRRVMSVADITFRAC